MSQVRVDFLTSTAMGPSHGDLLIIRRATGAYELVEAVTRTPITIASTFNELLAIAARKRGAVWQQMHDNRGRPLGDPTLVLPRIAI
jgi:hypothetical protein